jgi:hypothetical protein
MSFYVHAMYIGDFGKIGNQLHAGFSVLHAHIAYSTKCMFPYDTCNFLSAGFKIHRGVPIGSPDLSPYLCLSRLCSGA